MSHLNLETLARLIDDAPDPTEAGHLDICAQCRAELEALRADSAALRALPDPEPPIAAWLALEQTLKREGLIRRSPWATQLMRLAAVLIIFAFGSLAGALYMRRQATPLVATTSPIAAPAGSLVRQPLQLDTEPTAPAHVVATAAPLAAAVRPAATAEEAAARLRDAESAYVSALSRYSDFTAKTDNTDPVARLAALESIVATTRAALGQAPADPIINGYHLTAVAQRDATLRQIAASKQQTWY